MVIARKAVEEDYLAMSELIEDFFKENKFVSLDIELNAESSSELSKVLATKHIMLVLTQGKEMIGGIGGFVIPSLMNTNFKIFQEVFFYIKKGFRKYSKFLLDELENECRRRKLNSIIMAHPADENLDKMDKFYSARGYKVLEKHYSKRI